MSKTGIELISEERQRQIEKEGWSPEHDDQHTAGELVMAAVAYADCNPTMKKFKQQFVLRDDFRRGIEFRDPFPEDWSKEWDKRKKHPALRRLAIAGALIAAEMDRILRQSNDEVWE